MNIDNIWNEMEEKTKFDSDFLSLEVGKNPIRVLSDFVKVENVFKGKFPNSVYQRINTANKPLAADETITTQGWAWVIDRKTGELKIGKFGKSILGAIISLKNEPEYAFTDFPMPYDLTINNTGEGSNRYSVVAARNNSAVTDAEMAELNKKKPIKDIVASIIEKQEKTPEQIAKEKAPIAYPTEDSSAAAGIWEDEPTEVIE
jgi:hypothetical protein